MRRFLLFVLFFVLTSALAAAVVPAPPARAEMLSMTGDTVVLQAERLEVDLAAGEATLTGNVTLRRGDLVVSCPRVDLRFDQGPRVTWARGSGGVTAELRGVHAVAPSADLDVARQILELSGGVQLARGRGWLTADSARIDLTTSRVSLVQVKGSIPVAKAH